MKFSIHIQYACAVLLILSSIALAFIQAMTIKDIANGVLMYIAQAFLLAGSIFGLSAYVKSFRIKNRHNQTILKKYNALD